MKTWKLNKTTYRVSDFISWAKNGNLQLSPSFQRRPVWKKDAKSYLIDTIIRGLPIPIIFMREKRSDLISLEPQREIVDGQQRLRTILSFIDTNLIQNVTNEDIFFVKKIHNKEIANKSFKELDNEKKQLLLDYEFSVHILPPDVSDAEVLQIFARMNSTGVKLNNQELRNAEYFGEFKSSMYNLAAEQLQRWREWNIFSESAIARMEEVEFTSDLAMLIMSGIKAGTKKNLNEFYKQNDQKFKNKKEIEKRFRNIMDQIEDIFNDDISETIYSKLTFFYPLFAVLYDKKYGSGEIKPIKKTRSIEKKCIERIKYLSKREELLNAPEKVIPNYNRRPNTLSDRKVLFNYLLGKSTSTK